MSNHFAFSLTPILPTWVIAAISGALALLLVHGSLQLLRKKIPPRWVAILGLLRATIIAVLVLCLLQPVISYSRSAARLPTLLVLVDTSQSMGVKSSTDGKTRLEASLATIRGGRLLSQLKKQFDVRWFAFDRNAYPLEEGDLGGLRATGTSTHFADSLATAVANERQGDTDDGSALPARAMLVSDGNDLGTNDVVDAARKLGLPVDTFIPSTGDVESASANRITIANAQSPRSVMLGSEMQIVATLRADGEVRAPVQLSLLEGGQPLASESVTFPSGESERIVRLSHRPAEMGLRRYELKLSDQVKAAPYEFSVRVVNNQKQVLILEDNWRWEFKFLRRVIEDDPSFSFTALLSRGGGMHVQFSEADRKVNLAGFPQGSDDLSWFDTIVLGDVNPRRWPPGLAAGIARMVKDEGKSLVFIAGPGLEKFAETPELNALLPVELTSESARPIEGSIEVRPSREGAATPFFFNVNGSLPSLDRIYPPLRKRPAATILLEATTRANAYGNLIVIAEHTVGRGRVLFIGTDSLWNWQMSGPIDSQGVTPYAAFWQQAMRALTPPRSHTGDVTLLLQPDRTRYEAGQRVVVHAQYKSDRPLPATLLQLALTPPDQKSLPLVFAPDAAQPNTFRAEFDATHSGVYKISADITSDGKLAAEALTSIDVEPPRGEMNSTRIDESNLIRIAAATGGKAIRPADAATWPTSGTQARYSMQQTARIDLWNNLTLLFVLCGLLGADWLLRLLRGYV